MRKVFIDCGYHLGEGMSEFITTLGIDATWEIHAFEANPACEMESKIGRHNLPIHAHQAAVWIADKTLLFNQEHQRATGSPTANSTQELDGWGSVIAEINSSHTYENQVEVPAVDFARFLQQFDGNSEVYCKMDIEGAEFSILRHLIATDTLRIIKLLWVEFHPLDFATEDNETVRQLAESVGRHTHLQMWK